MVAQTKKKQDDVTKIIMKMLKKMSEYEGEKCFGGWGSGKQGVFSNREPGAMFDSDGGTDVEGDHAWRCK